MAEETPLPPRHRPCVYHHTPCSTLDMGSKMSFSRRSSDQNSVSELTSVPCQPLIPFHASTDCKQIAEEKICKEEDDSHNLCSRSGEGPGMKDVELNPPASESLSSSEHLESDCLVNSETKSEANWEQSKQTISPVTMEEKSQTTRTRDIHGRFVEVRRKRGRPPKKKYRLIEALNDQEPAGVDAVEQEFSNTIPCTVSMASHDNDEQPNNVDGPIISDPPHNEVSVPPSISDCKPEDDIPVVPKRKRGRPRKTAATTPTEKTADTSAASVPVDKDSGPARRLRSREQQPLSPDRKINSEFEVDLKPISTLVHTSNNKLNRQAIKRGRSKLSNQQIPAKVSRHSVSHEASSMLCSDQSCGVSVGAYEQGKLNADLQETGVDEKEGYLCPQSGKGQQPMTKLMEGTLPQRRLRSKVATGPSPGIPLQCQRSLNLVSPRGIVMPNATTSHGPGQPSKLVEIPANVKTEDIEMELDHFSSITESNTTLQYNANIIVKSECPNSRQNIFGHRRRRRRRNALLQREHLAVPNQGQEGTNEFNEEKTDCGDSVKEGDSSARSTRRRGKSLLKCKDCGRTFKFLSQYVIHQRIHTGERPFKCQECGKGFTKNSNLNLHLKTHRRSNAYQKCPYCKIKFSCSEYSSHMEMHSRKLNQRSEKAESEKRSRAQQQNRKNDNDHDDQAFDPPVTSVKKDPKQVCQYCGKTFPFRSALIRHVRVHTGEKPYKCDICGKAFGQAYFLRVHELTHWSVKRYNCTLCGKSFTHYSNAKNHSCRFIKDTQDIQCKRRLKPSLSYTCHICKNTFFQLQEFNSHMKAHTGAKLYRCLMCDKLFGVLSEFTAHRSHCKRARGEGDDPGSVIKDEETAALFQYSLPPHVGRCSYRSKSVPPVSVVNCETQKHSSQAQSLQPSRTHRKKPITNSKKPFQSTIIPSQHFSHFVSTLNKLDNRSDPRKYLCPSCGRLFRHMGRLRAHMLTHARGQSYTCGCCGKTLENWKKLWHHQRIHRQRRGRFTCPQCGQGFRFVEPYKRHMSEHPEFKWIQGKPKKVSLPYQCEQCSASFKTLDLLFSHQLCHSSTQDTHRAGDYDLSIDHGAHSNRRMFTPPINNYVTSFHPEPQQNNFVTSSSPQTDNSNAGPLLKYLDPVLPEPPLTPTVSFAQQSLDSYKAVQRPGGTLSYQDTETSHSHIGENVFRKQVTSLKTVKRRVTPDATGANEGSSEGIKCAVCGNAYSIISDLYQHYLQHARGQL